MTDDLVGRLRRLGAMPADETARGFIGSYVASTSEAAARIEALEGALRTLIATYDGMETGDGEPCPDIAAARQLFLKDHPHAD